MLLKLEAKTDSTSWLQSNEISGFDARTVTYHYALLTEAGLIQSLDISSMEDADYAAFSLTWQGHEFLNKIKNDTVWNKVKSTIQSKGIDLSLEAIKMVATNLISSMF
ncbi:DUF2513 domain-containing protein [Actinobacillus equuli subsp. equuli]|nr:DUF2513 domain-containing protein [Actinobacillus equuli]WGE56090.1 DUF2513 domain-containing protein [Actinobacillus equuli subsp. equuli]